MTWHDEVRGDVDHEIELIEAGDKAPIGLLARLIQQVRDALPALASAGERYLQAKSNQESLKALEIRARIESQLSLVEIERQRMVDERELRIRAATAAEKESAQQAELRRIELEARRLEAVAHAAVALKALHDLGVQVDLKVLGGPFFPTAVSGGSVNDASEG